MPHRLLQARDACGVQSVLEAGGGYRRYYSNLDDFYQDVSKHRVASLNIRALDLGRIDGFRISRFVCDPRDLVVSRYFYHKRGSELWTRLKSPTGEDWKFANCQVPWIRISMRDCRP